MLDRAALNQTRSPKLWWRYSGRSGTTPGRCRRRQQQDGGVVEDRVLMRADNSCCSGMRLSSVRLTWGDSASRLSSSSRCRSCRATRRRDFPQITDIRLSARGACCARIGRSRSAGQPDGRTSSWTGRGRAPCGGSDRQASMPPGLARSHRPKRMSGRTIYSKPAPRNARQHRSLSVAAGRGTNYDVRIARHVRYSGSGSRSAWVFAVKVIGVGLFCGLVSRTATCCLTPA